MARARVRTAGDGRFVHVLLDREQGEVLDMTSELLGVSPGEVLVRGLYLMGLSGQVLHGQARVALASEGLQRRAFSLRMGSASPL